MKTARASFQTAGSFHGHKLDHSLGSISWPFSLMVLEILIHCTTREVLFIDVIIYSNVGINSEKAMAPHSSTLAWKIPWAAEPDRLQSLASLRVGHD